MEKAWGGLHYKHVGVLVRKFTKRPLKVPNFHFVGVAQIYFLTLRGTHSKKKIKTYWPWKF